jgi:hypothetical protein
VMVYSRVRGKTGAYYEYYGCFSLQGRRAQKCDARHIPVPRIERAVEEFYAAMRLSSREQQAVQTALVAYAEEQMHEAQRKCEQHTRRLQTLQRQQQKLLQAFYRGSIDEAVLAAEQQRIDAERAEARRWAAAATHDASEIQEALDEALALLTDPQIRYRQADPHARRIINQALFEKLLVHGEEVDDVKPSPWVSELHRAARSPLSCAKRAGITTGRRRNGHDPVSGAAVLNKTYMVPRAGLEPAPPD